MNYSELTEVKPYPAYKTSQIPWIGGIPEHWEVSHLRYFCECLDGRRIPLSAENRGDKQGNIPYWGANSVIDHINGWIFDEPLVLVGEDGAPFTDTTRSVAFFVNEKVWVNNHIHVLRCSKELRPEFLVHILNSVDYKDFISGSTRDKLTQQRLLDIPIQLAPPTEQAAIVRFLDHADEQIQHYIAGKKRFIALLEEERQALVHQAVTRGLDPNVPLKDSGVEWLGDVPEHWEIRPLKRWVSTKITDGPHETPVLLEEGIPFMSAEAMVGGRLDFNRRRGLISREQHELCCRKCSPQINDIFMCKSGATTGKVAIVDTTKEFSIWSPLALIRVDPQKVLAYLLFEVLETKYVQQQIEKHWSYGTQPNLAMNTMERIAVMLPPIAEQKKLLTYLDKATQKIVDTIARSRRQINLMNEYRTRLIADVVTGQLDVREAAAQLPAAP